MDGRSGGEIMTEKSLDQRISEKVSITGAVVGLALVALYFYGPADDEFILLTGLTIVSIATGADQIIRRIRGA